MIRYTFREDGFLTIKNAKRANPQKIGAALVKVAEEHKGRLVPSAVVEAARNAKNPLHPHFEWSDELAAESYRLDQARTLIRSVQIISDDTTDTAPAFLSVTDKIGTSYRTMSDVMDSADLQHSILAAAERDLVAFEKRYKALSDICEIIRDARDKIVARRSKHESRIAS